MSAEAVNENANPKTVKPEERLCPLLTIAGAMTPQIADVNAPPKPFSAVGCQGVRCALYLPQTDAQGNLVGGGCAITMLPTVVDSHAGVVGGVLKVLASRAKITPAPGVLG